MPKIKTKRAHNKISLVRDNPALIDSSYTAFFTASVIGWAYVFSGYFPGSVTLQAFLLIALFAFMLYFFQFLLLQFYDAVTILRMTILYASFSALLTILSAVKGPIAEGQIPVIQVIFIGSYVHFSGSGSSLIVASMFTFYGTVGLICAAVTAGVLEWLYDGLQRFIPRPIMKLFRRTDKKIDAMSDSISWKMFAVREWPGVVAAVLVLLLYGLLYSLLLIA